MLSLRCEWGRHEINVFLLKLLSLVGSLSSQFPNFRQIVGNSELLIVMSLSVFVVSGFVYRDVIVSSCVLSLGFV